MEIDSYRLPTLERKSLLAEIASWTDRPVIGVVCSPQVVNSPSFDKLVKALARQIYRDFYIYLPGSIPSELHREISTLFSKRRLNLPVSYDTSQSIPQDKYDSILTLSPTSNLREDSLYEEAKLTHKAKGIKAANPLLSLTQARLAASATLVEKSDSPYLTANVDGGLYYVGFFKGALGLGQAARMYVESLNQVDVHPKLIDVTQLGVTTPLAFDKPLETSIISPKIVILHVNPETNPVVAQETNIFEESKDAYKIGCWAWEGLDFPDLFARYGGRVNEVWALSDFTAETYRQKLAVPVITVPIAIDVPNVQADKAKFKLSEDEFIFLFNFDYNSHTVRKNPKQTIDAFRQAFKPTEPVRLLLKTINGHKKPEKVAELVQYAEGLNVTFLDETLSSQDRFQLLNSCDAYVSLHRAEGFGLGMAEAMAYGKPVVATGWSGNMTFMNAANSYLVDFTMEPLEEASGPYAKGMLWAQPRMSSAVEQMRLAWTDSELRKTKSLRAQEDIATQLNPEAIGALMKERLIQIHKGFEGTIPLARTPIARDLEAEAMGGRLAGDLLKRPGHYLKRIPWIFQTLKAEGVKGLKGRALGMTVTHAEAEKPEDQ